MRIQDIIEAVRNIDASDFTEEEAQEVINNLIKLINTTEDALSEIGVYHQIDVHLGDYGNGRSLALEDCEISWHEYSAGEWISSSATC